MRSAQIFRGFIGIFHYIQTFSVSGCYLPQRRLFLFYKVDPAFIKTILLHSALCRVPQGKKRNAWNRTDHKKQAGSQRAAG